MVIVPNRIINQMIREDLMHPQLPAANEVKAP